MTTINPKIIPWLKRQKLTLEQIDTTLAWAHQPDHHILCIEDQRYPTLLKETPSPPPLLYICGQLSALYHTQLAIVGSRKASPAGIETAQEFGYRLARIGWTITSGLALGIDAAGHQGALAAKGVCVAVMGCGLNHIYPRRHRALAEKICEQGALVSEFPLAAEPLAAYFPQRNRIISGLSLGTLVVEAQEKSGSLITAKWALAQNREVFAIPGHIRSQFAQGAHSLIKNGAKLVTHVNDIMEEFKDRLDFTPLTQLSFPLADSTHRSEQSLDPEEVKLLNCIGFELSSIEKIVKRSRSPIGQLATKLLTLEINQYIRKVPGGYIRVKR